MLKWLHISGCQWDSATCGNAAEGGHLEVLKWLHKVSRCRLTPGLPRIDREWFEPSLRF